LKLAVTLTFGGITTGRGLVEGEGCNNVALGVKEMVGVTEGVIEEVGLLEGLVDGEGLVEGVTDGDGETVGDAEAVKGMVCKVMEKFHYKILLSQLHCKFHASSMD